MPGMERLKGIILAAAVFPAMIGWSALGSDADQKLAEENLRCPNGHSNFTKVPVIYGLPSHMGKKKEEMTASERAEAEKIERREIIWGGCSINETSPNHVLQCQGCRFELQKIEAPISGLPNRAFLLWSRTSNRLQALDESFTQYARELAKRVLFEVTQPIVSQSLEADLLTTERTGFEMDSKQFEEFSSIFARWARDLKLPDTFHAPSRESLLEAPYQASSVRPEKLLVRILFSEAKDNRVRFTLFVCHESHADTVNSMDADGHIEMARHGIPANLR